MKVCIERSWHSATWYVCTINPKLSAPCSASIPRRADAVQLALSWRDKLQEPRIHNVCADLATLGA